MVLGVLFINTACIKTFREKFGHYEQVKETIDYY